MLSREEQDEIMRLARLASTAARRAASAQRSPLFPVSARSAKTGHERALERLRDYLKEVG